MSETLPTELNETEKEQEIPLENKEMSEKDELHQNLMNACKNGYLDMLVFLINKNYSNNDEVKREVLLTASESSHLNIIKFFLKKKYITNKKDIQDALLALDINNKNSIDIFKFLVEFSSNTENIKLDTIILNNTLLNACKNDNFEIFKYLIEEPEIGNTNSIKGNTNNTKTPYITDFKCINDAFKLASKFGNLKIIEYLINKKCIKASTIDRALSDSGARGRFEVVKFLMDNNCIKSKEYIQYTSCIASDNGHLDIVEFLVKGGHIDKKNKCNTLNIACNRNYCNIVEFLVEGDYVNIDDVNNALTEASKHNSLEVVKFLVEKNHINIEGMNQALKESIRSNYFDVVKCLVDNGAFVNLNDLSEKTISSKIIEYLKNKKALIEPELALDTDNK